MATKTVQTVQVNMHAVISHKGTKNHILKISKVVNFLTGLGCNKKDSVLNFFNLDQTTLEAENNCFSSEVNANHEKIQFE